MEYIHTNLFGIENNEEQKIYNYNHDLSRQKFNGTKRGLIPDHTSLPKYRGNKKTPIDGFDSRYPPTQ